MNKEDLIKKLEKIESPEIELRGHKSQLRTALLNSGYFNEKRFKIKNLIMNYLKILVPAGVALVLLLVVGIAIFSPVENSIKEQKAMAIEIAENDPQIKELIGEYEAKARQVKLQNNKAHITFLIAKDGIRPKDDAISVPGSPGIIELMDPLPQKITVVVELELGEVVGEIEKEEVPFIDVGYIYLTVEEEAKAIEIAENDLRVQEKLLTSDLAKLNIAVTSATPEFALLPQPIPDGGIVIDLGEVWEITTMAHVAFRADDLYFYVLVNLDTKKVELIMEPKDSPFIDRE